MHCVQIGLGTFATFVQNLAGTRGEWDRMVGWLMEMTSAPRGCRNEFKGVAVEPVLEHVRRLNAFLMYNPSKSRKGLDLFPQFRGG